MAQVISFAKEKKTRREASDSGQEKIMMEICRRECAAMDWGHDPIDQWAARQERPKRDT
jgi:hypothetical protein